jgi:hypothetical protein
MEITVGMVPSEFPGVHLMFDNDTQLLVAIFHEVFEPMANDEGIVFWPVKYVRVHKREIEIAGQLFAYLGLAKPDTQSPLGWRPTHRLLEVIAKRAARWSKPLDRFMHPEDSLTISLLCDAVFGDLTDHSVYTTGLGFRVLHALGLLRDTTDGDSLPSLELRQLFAEAYYAGRQANREHKGKLALQALTNEAGRQSAR